MARGLIVGCGCRGCELGAELVGLGWQVRGTSRTGEGIDAMEASGLEAARANPERPGTILELCGDVAVVVWLLGSAVGTPEETSAVHGPRLERLLEKLVDTPVRGFAYEAAGSVDSEYLAGGREIVARAGERWRIPAAFLTAARDEPGWAARAAAVVAGLLTA